VKDSYIRKLILSPCGTSLFINNTEKKVRELISKYANFLDIPETEEKEILRKHVKNRKELFLKLSPTEAAKYSAEVNGLYHIYKKFGGFLNNKKDEHILLATDTWLGKESANIIREWLENQGFNNVYLWNDIGGLRTDSLENFHCAISELIKRLHEVLPGYKEKKFYILFNLTGGFKSIQGILQTLAQFYADEAVYVFETSKELLRIPRIPVILDLIGEVKKHLKVWRRSSLGLSVSLQDVKGIKDVFLLKIGSEVTLSPWGELVWQQVKQKIYEECFLSPPSPQISYTKDFEKEVNKLEKDRIYEINKRMDELALHLEREDHPNPRSLRCHQLKNKVKGATHEIYAWSDRGACRIYGICKNHKFFEIICLGKHL